MSDDHYFSASPWVASRPGVVRLTLADGVVELTTDRGVFAADRPDPGTVVLLEAVAAPARHGHLLDLGCGYGPIAVTLARRSPEATVWAVDVNQRAVDLAGANAVRLGLANVHAALPDAVPDAIRFAEIWSNPPIRVGKAALHDLLLRWLPRLEPEGRAWLVVHKHLGSDSLARWLADQGFATVRLASRRGYRALEVRAREALS